MKKILATTVLAGALTSLGQAVVDINYVEDFDSDTANWIDVSEGPVDYNATGGPDGGAHVSVDFNYVDFVAGSQSPVLFRANDFNDASGDAFVGNWIAEEIISFSFDFQHNAPDPINVFARFASSFNFPGAIAVDFTPVLPNTWTTVTFDISPFNPEFVSFEGTNFDAVFNSVGNIQIGVSGDPLAGVDQDFTFRVDKVQVEAVPEPSTYALLALGAGALALLRRRRKS
ncbi:MAG: PEP-CTERM sorting domain-containing protein [Verrucomicrobiota bacterium]